VLSIRARQLVGIRTPGGHKGETPGFHTSAGNQGRRDPSEREGAQHCSTGPLASGITSTMSKAHGWFLEASQARRRNITKKQTGSKELAWVGCLPIFNRCVKPSKAGREGGKKGLALTAISTSTLARKTVGPLKREGGKSQLQIAFGSDTVQGAGNTNRRKACTVIIMMRLLLTRVTRFGRLEKKRADGEKKLRKRTTEVTTTLACGLG